LHNYSITCFFTVISTNYSAQAAVFVEKLKNIYPNSSIYVFITDNYGNRFNDLFEGTSIVDLHDIGFPDYDLICSLYEPVELNTAVKPLCFAYLFNLSQFEQVFYIDPDTWFFSEMTEAHDLLAGGAPIVLTPHTNEPIEDSQQPNDGHMAKSGIYNLGFCGMRDCEAARGFVGWWARKLRRDCRVDIANGIFVDQKWCDAVPALVPGAAVLHHPGYNIGYWNFAHRPVDLDEGGNLQVNGERVRFLHFSGLPMRDAESVSVHQDRFTAKHLSPLMNDIILAYRMALIGKRYFEAVKCEYQPDIHKLIGNASLARILARFYDEHLHGSCDVDFRRFVLEAPLSNRAVRVRFGEDTLLSDLIGAVYFARPDLREYFGQHPGDGPEGRAFERKLLTWAAERLSIEMRPAALLAKRHNVLMDVFSEAGYHNSQSSTPTPATAWRNLLEGLPTSRLFALARSTCEGFGAQPVEAPTPDFADVIMHARPDVRKAYDITTVAGRRGLLQWLATYFTREYGEVKSLSGFFDALHKGGDAWVEAIERADAPHAPPPVDRALVAAMDWGHRHPRDYAIYRQDRVHNAIRFRPRRDGALLVGYPRAEMGMGEHVRNTAVALSSRRYPFSIFDFNSGLDCGLNDRSCDAWISSDWPDRLVNLLHINADQTLALHKCLGDAFFSAAEYNVGYWAWELERFPKEWSGAIDLVDELWAPSTFIADAMRMATAKPVNVMPLRVDPGEAEDPGLEVYGVMPEDFVFLFFFDFSSFKQRKNPEGVLDAFRRAFPDPARDRDVRLVIKTIGEARNPEAARRLRAQVADDPRVVIITGTLPKARLNGLVAQCSAFVSLHRSEGFGRGLAEAMFYGKPTIATGYSGNLDFMSAETSYLVDYDLVPVRQGEYVYPSGARWAAPRVDHAAALMREVREGYAAAMKRAELGRAYIRSRHSTAAIADKLLGRLGTVAGPVENQHAAE
jgi:glycosyltransferase involved in cell wall biosynthesis